ncbi:MAG: methyltransferase domain-containing protein [Hyphomicrobiaceae bacterium]|nr:methyltransferase domain-containing protein [Hyphomicrobiaceae bacterium]
MRVLVATDAWHPQVNGVVRTLMSLAESARKLGVPISFLTPEGFPSVAMPTYPSLRCALPTRREIAQRIERARPNAIHVATEGPIGHTVRAYCIKHGLPFTTSYTTRFPEYITARVPVVPEAWSYAVLRRFHAPATVTMVSTRSLMEELAGRGFKHLGLWTRGVDTELFRPERAILLDLPRPIFVSVGRVAVEKNLEAFLSLDLPGTKLVIGNGPQEAELRRRFPDAVFLGHLEGETLAAHIAASDVFVFPSKTDTFGIVQLEALACGVPVAAYPVTGPRDVIGDRPIGALDKDLHQACLSALKVSRAACRAFALDHTWEMSARQFLGHARNVAVEAAAGPRMAYNAPLLAAAPNGRGRTLPSTLTKRRDSDDESNEMTDAFDRETITKAYARWAPIYDLVFAKIFERGHRAAVAACERVGGRILEVGVGTGLTLPYYTHASRVFGIDFSEPMLAKARQRVAEEALTHVEGLSFMDAEKLQFPDESFDVVVAQCVVNTVPHAEIALDEFARVLKPGGEIVLLNRVGAEAGPRLTFERWFQPMARKLGWQSDFPWERFARWAERTPHDIRLLERRPVPPFGHFSLIRFGKAAADRNDGLHEEARAA